MKIAYWSSEYQEPKPVKNLSINVSNKDSATENAGRNGICLLERTTEPLMGGDLEPEFKEKKKRSNTPEPDKVMDLLVNLGDSMDVKKEYVLADFADFLIRKFGEMKKENYTKLYNQLMLKINASDIPDRNETLKKLTKIFSRTLLLEYYKHNDLSKAKISAYNKAVHRADQYLSKG